MSYSVYSNVYNESYILYHFIVTLIKQILTYLLMPFTVDVFCQLNILGHYGDMFCMNGTQVCILEHAKKVSSFL